MCWTWYVDHPNLPIYWPSTTSFGNVLKDFWDSRWNYWRSRCLNINCCYMWAWNIRRFSISTLIGSLILTGMYYYWLTQFSSSNKNIALFNDDLNKHSFFMFLSCVCALISHLRLYILNDKRLLQCPRPTL